MNKLFKYALICVGVVSFIELQIITYTSINNMININTNKPMEINSPSKNKNMRDNGIEAPGGGVGDISENAITPGENEKNSSSTKTTDESNSNKKNKITTSA